MTKDDALRMMLGPFKAWRDVPGNEDVVEELTKIINAVEKVLEQPEQEPVEYQIKILGERWTHCAKHLYDPSNPNTRALYTHPPQRTEPDDIASIIACRNILDAQPVPAQRTWVGLTDEDIGDAYVAWDDTNGASFADFARAIEAKLKQKNGYAEENT